MDTPTILVLGLAPGIFWLWYFYRKDKLEPEPKHLIVRTFLWGMVSAVPAIILEIPFKGLLLTVVAAPIIEEYLKYFVVRRTIYNHAEFDEPMDGIVYAAAAALGFASAENVLYLFTASASPQNFQVTMGTASASGAVLTVFVLRALFSVPGHVLFSSLWGYALGRAKFSEEESRRKLIVKGLLLAMLMHGLFNYLASTGPVFSLGMLVFLFFAWRMVHRKISGALADSPHGLSPSGVDRGIVDEEKRTGGGNDEAG
jgi:RsiW-degrading membrane proteinase PrsW (M82 family)